MGKISNLGHFGKSEQSTYLTADKSFRKWDLNLGVGYGYGSNPDKWIAKAIVNVPLEWSWRRPRR